MLPQLTDEIWGAVLQRLDHADAESARLACRRLDLAGRLHLPELRTLEISRVLYEPLWYVNLTRLVGLTELLIDGPHNESVPMQLWLMAMAGGGAGPGVAAVLAGISALQVTNAGFADGAALAGVLRWFPRLRDLSLPQKLPPGELAEAFASAPEHITRLRYNQLLNAATAADLVARLPRLASLHIGGVDEEGGGERSGSGGAAGTAPTNSSDGATADNVLAALRLNHLTQLLGNFSLSAGLQLPPCSTTGTPALWPALRELVYVSLPAAQLAALAAHAPQLEVLEAVALDDWAAACRPPAAADAPAAARGSAAVCLPRVRSARLWLHVQRSGHSWLGALLPAVEQLALQPESQALLMSPLDVDCSGLVHVTRLLVGPAGASNPGMFLPPISTRCLQSALRLPALRSLGVSVAAQDMSLLARATGLEVLAAAVSTRVPEGRSRNSGGDGGGGGGAAAGAGAAAAGAAAVAGAAVGGGNEADAMSELDELDELEGNTELAAALSTAVGLPRLRELYVEVECELPANLASLAEFVHAAPCSLTRLVMTGPMLDTTEAATLASSRTLRQLTFVGSDYISDEGQQRYTRMAQQHGPRGLHVRVERCEVACNALQAFDNTAR